MQFPYVHICAILSDDRINDRKSELRSKRHLVTVPVLYTDTLVIKKQIDSMKH